MFSFGSAIVVDVEGGREGGRERSETMHQKQQTLQAIPSASSGNYLTTELNINS